MASRANELNALNKTAASGSLSRREFLRRAAALGVTTGFAGSSLMAGAEAPQPFKGGLLRAAMQGGGATDSLDPATWLSQVQHSFGQSWGEALTNVSPKGELVPRLAEEVDSSPDAVRWTFKLRKGIVFHNGKELDARDVVATLERHSDEESKSGALGLMRGIQDVRATGSHELVITTTEPNADLPFLLSDYHLVIQPNGGKEAPDAGIGTGPYKVTEFRPGVRQRAERFADYWNPEEFGHAAEIEILVVNDPTARTAALQSGLVHMANRIEPRVADLVRTIPSVRVHNAAGRAHYVFLMHCNTPPFSDNDLRLALKYAIDREDMLDRILRGYGSLGNDFPISPSYPLFPEDIPQRHFDPDRAAYHYKKSGHRGPIVLRTSDVAFPGAVDAALLFKKSAARAGIELDVRREPGDGYWSEVWNKEPFCASYWSGRPTQDQMYSTAYTSNADWNDTRFFREDFDRLALRARGELDTDKRRQLYREMALMVRNEGGVLLPMFNDYIEATTDQVGGWFDYPLGEMMAGFALSKCWLKS